MEINQVYRAPSIPKLSRRNIKSTLISGAIKPDIELKKTKFSFIKPLVSITPDSLSPVVGGDENKNPLIKYIESNIGIEKVLEQSNKILSQIKEQLSLDFLSRINEEKKELEENKKRIAAQRVKDKEKKIEAGKTGILGNTFAAIVAPAKSIFQKILDFFSIILTGILLNTAFKWLSKPENREKLKQFFQFLKDYWKELLVVFGAVKLLGLVNKIRKIAYAIKGLIDFFKSKPTLPCNCTSSPTKGMDDCLPLKDCIDSLVKNPRRNGPMIEALASLIIASSTFEPVRKLLNQKGLTVPPVLAPPAAKPQKTLQQQYRQSRQGVPAGGFTPTNVRNAQRAAQQAPTLPQTNQQRLIGKRPWWDAFGLFGGASAQIQRQSVENKAREASKTRPQNLNELIGQAKEEYKNNGEKQRVWLQTKEGWAVSYGREFGPTGEQNPYATPKVKIYTPLQTLKMGQPDPLQYLFFATNLPAMVGPFPGAKSPIPQQSGRSSYSKPLLGTRTAVEPSLAEPPPIVAPPRTIVKKGSTTLRSNTVQRVVDRLEKGISVIGGKNNLSKEELDLLERMLDAAGSGVRRSKGGTILGLAGGGTVGGPGQLGIDSIPATIASGVKTLMGGVGSNALLAPGEEVIRTSSAMLFRPLLKDINDNAGRLWQNFTSAIRKQEVNNNIQSDIIKKFNQILGDFKDLLDKESSDLIKKSRSSRRPPTGGGIIRSSSSSSTSSKPISGNITSSTPKSTQSQISQQSIQTPKISSSKIVKYQPNITVDRPIDITQHVVKPQVEKTILGDQKVYVVPLKVSEISKIQKKPTINYIKMPPQTVNLGANKTGSVKLPSSGEATKVPSISPIDSSNYYVSSTPLMYGILV